MIAILLFGFFLNYTAASVCSPQDFKGPVTFPIKMILDSRYTPIRTSGNITIIDGCTFMVSDFTLINSGVTKWFGAKTKSVEPFLVSDEYVNAFVSRGSQIFNLKSIGNSAVSFKDFDEFRLIDIGKNDLIAIATIPKSQKPIPIYAANAVKSTVISSSSGKSSAGMMSILLCVLLHALQF